MLTKIQWGLVSFKWGQFKQEMLHISKYVIVDYWLIRIKYKYFLLQLVHQRMAPFVIKTVIYGNVFAMV